MIGSGAAALAAEVVWARMLREVFGSTVESVSTVLGVFFGGLALGAYLASRWAESVRRPVRAYALLEVSIGACVLLTLPAIAYFAGQVPVWEAGTGSPWVWRLLRVILASVLLLPATTAMGATFPLMVRLLGGRTRTGRLIGLLYAANTFGGVGGALTAGFVTIGAFGCRASIAGAAALNFATSAVALLWLRELAPASLPTAAESPPGEDSRRADGAVLFATCVAGAAALAAEVVWTRAMVFGFGTSTYAFSSVLAAVLIAVGAGGALFAWLPQPRRRERALGIILVVEGFLLALSSFAFAQLDLMTLHGTAIAMAEVLPRPLTWPLLWMGVALLVAGPATLLSGYAFPLAAHARALQLGSASRGSGQVSAANTAGTIAGSLAGGFLLLPALGPHRALAVVAVAVAATGALLAVRPAARRVGAVLAAGAAVWTIAMRSPSAVLRADIERPQDRVLFAAEGAQSSVRVFEQEVGNQTLRRLAIDGQTIASNGMGDLMVKEIVLAHIPFLLHEAPRRVALVGLGTGITLGAIASHDVVREMVCAEIVPEVWDAARLFDDDNGRVLDDPRLTKVVGDGVQYLRGTSRIFDAIVGDEKVSLHAAANGTFFSRQYYELVKAHLAPGGVFVQWVPLILPPDDQATVMRTFASVFRDGVLMTLGRFGFIQVGGTPTPVLNVNHAARVLADPEARRALSFPTIDLTQPLFVAATALARAGEVERLAGSGPIQTVDHPVLDYGIARWDFRYETYRQRAARTLEAFVELAARVPSPWLAPSDENAAAARRAVTALLTAHRQETLGDRRAVLEALATLDGPQGLPSLHSFAQRYRSILAAQR
jgi:spermidine synthase